MARVKRAVNAHKKRRDILDHTHEEVKLALAAAASQSRPRPGWPPAPPAASVRREQVKRTPPGPGIAI